TAIDHGETTPHGHTPERLAQCPRREAKLLRHDFLSAILGGALRALQREHGFYQMRPLTLAGHQRGLWGEEAVGMARNRVNQFIEAGTRLAGNKVNNLLPIES